MNIQMDNYVINPHTGRKIKIGGKTYQEVFGKLNKNSRYDVGSLTREWKQAAPKIGKEREQLASNCGGKCFLMPKERKFPICARCKKNMCECKLNCKGIIELNNISMTRLP